MCMVESIVTKNRLLFRYATGPTVYCHEIVFLAISAQLAITTKAYCPSLFVVIVSFLSYAVPFFVTLKKRLSIATKCLLLNFSPFLLMRYYFLFVIILSKIFICKGNL